MVRELLNLGLTGIAELRELIDETTENLKEMNVDDIDESFVLAFLALASGFIKVVHDAVDLAIEELPG